MGSSRCELYVARDALIGVYHRMNLDTAFLPAHLRMAPHSLENGVGEQTDSRRVYDTQPFHPFLRAATAAVR